MVASKNPLYALPIVLLCCIFIFCSADSRKNKYKKLFKGMHSKIGIELLTDRDKTRDIEKFYLRILKKNASYQVHEFLSFKNEPYLSNSIGLVCVKDTIHPMGTQIERSYEAGNEIVYLMVFLSDSKKTCQSPSSFIINNFTSLGDTLRIAL